MTIFKHILVLALAALLGGPAIAAEPKDCANNQAYDQLARQLSLRADYYDSCKTIVKKMLEVQSTAQAALKNSNATAATSDKGGQGAELDNAALVADAGSTTAQRKASIASWVASSYEKLYKEVDEKTSDLNKDYEGAVVPGGTVNGQMKDSFTVKYKAARADWENIRKVIVSVTNTGRSISTDSTVTAVVLDDQADRTRNAGRRLAGKEPKPARERSGVSTNTLVALGGAGLIAAGTVGGLAYFGNKAIDKADRKAEERIEQANKAAEERIKQIEEAAKNMINYVKDGVTGVLRDADDTANRILIRAMNATQDLTSSLSAELNKAFGDLGNEQVKKLNTEMNGVFDSLIAKANTMGDDALVQKLTNAKKSMADQFAAEFAKRGITP